MAYSSLPLNNGSQLSPLSIYRSRKGLLIENAADLPQREDGDGTEHPETQQEPDLTSGNYTHLLFPKNSSGKICIFIVIKKKMAKNKNV